MNYKKIVSFLITTVLSVVFIWLFENSQTASFILPFLISACLCVNFLYCGKEYSLVSLCLIGIFSYLVFDKSPSIVFSSLVLTVIGVVIGYMLKKEKSQPVIICAGAVGFFILYVGILIFMSNALGENAVVYTVNLLKPYFLDALETSIYSMRIEGMFAGVDEYLTMFLDSVILLMPAIIIILSAVMGYVLLFVVSVVLKLIRSEHRFTVLFSRFKADSITIIIYFVSMLASMFINNDIPVIVFSNIHTILQFVLQICGLSLIDAYFIRKKLHIIPRIIVVLAIFFASMLPVIAAVLVILAAFDSNRDFRNLNGKNE